MGLDACAFEPGRRFVTERGKKGESRNLNPGLTAWVKTCCLWLPPSKIKNRQYFFTLKPFSRIGKSLHVGTRSFNMFNLDLFTYRQESLHFLQNFIIFFKGMLMNFKEWDENVWFMHFNVCLLPLLIVKVVLMT